MAENKDEVCPTCKGLKVISTHINCRDVVHCRDKMTCPKCNGTGTKFVEKKTAKKK
jgi:DnaJ-class molecular chaperone